MYIQDYFKSGKLKKSKKPFDSIPELMNLFKEMNGGLEFKKDEVENNFKRRDIIFNNDSKKNLWNIMEEYGFKISK
jgi:hypothetical protein